MLQRSNIEPIPIIDFQYRSKKLKNKMKNADENTQQSQQNSTRIKNFTQKMIQMKAQDEKGG